VSVFADFAQLTKPGGQCFELFNRERSAAYASGLGLKEVAVPVSDQIAQLCALSPYSTPVGDGVFWASDPLMDLVTGFIPMSIVGLEGSTISQEINESASGFSTIGETTQDSRSVTFEGVIVGADCCAVARYKRRFNGWLADCLSCEGMEMRLLTCLPGEIQVCDRDPIEVEAEWITLCGVALTSGLTRVANRVRNDAGCGRCGGSRIEVVRFTVTATDPHLYQDPLCLGDCTFTGEAASCNLIEFLELLCCPDVDEPVTLDKERKPVSVKLDGTACPIGWDIEDYDPEKCYLVPALIEQPAAEICKPYRVRLLVREDLTTEWVPVNPDRWPDDGSVPCNCDIIVADIEHPNPGYQPCADCPGFARACAIEAGLTVGIDGLIDITAIGNQVHWWTGPGSVPALEPLFDYFKCIKLTGTNGAGVALPAWSPQAVIDACGLAANGAQIWVDFAEYVFGIRPAFTASSPTDALCNMDFLDGIPGLTDPLSSEDDAVDCASGDEAGEHCQRMTVTTLNALADPQTAECFTITLNDDMSWDHPGWDFERDGVPPAFGALVVDCGTSDTDDGCDPQVRDCALTMTVDTDEITWAFTDPVEQLDPTTGGFPAECTILFTDQEAGTYEDTQRVPDPTCGTCGSIDISGCLQTGCPTPTVPTISDPGEGCDQCALPLVTAHSCKRAPAPGIGVSATPRFVICAGSEDMRQFEMRAFTDPLGVFNVWDFTQNPPVPVLDADGEPVLRPDAHEVFDDCNVCAGFGVRFMPAGSTLEIDVKRRKATLFCNGAEMDAASLLYGAGSSAFSWPSLVFTGCDPIVLCASVDATGVALDGIASDPATWTAYWQQREVG